MGVERKTVGGRGCVLLWGTIVMPLLYMYIIKLEHVVCLIRVHDLN